MSATEGPIETASCKYAKTLGCRPIKLAGGATGEPDRAFLLPRGYVWLVEFKSPVGRLSKRQQLVHLELVRIGHPVSVIRSTDQFKQGLTELLLRIGA